MVETVGIEALAAAGGFTLALITLIGGWNYWVTRGFERNIRRELEGLERNLRREVENVEQSLRREMERNHQAVSYTHLTLPTKRIV